MDEPTIESVVLLAETLVELADSLGLVVSIEQLPLRPLGMGNFESIVSVREKLVRE